MLKTPFQVVYCEVLQKYYSETVLRVVYDVTIIEKNFHSRIFCEMQQFSNNSSVKILI